MPTQLADLDTVIASARSVVERVIWCTVTTVGRDGAPRSRLMHPVWSWDGEAPVALVTARPTPLKLDHLATNPRVACFYWDPAHDTVAIDARAEWLRPDELAAGWAAIAGVPAPVGFDPAIIWPDGPASPGCAMLRFHAERIIVTPAGQPGLRWRRPRVVTP